MRQTMNGIQQELVPAVQPTCRLLQMDFAMERITPMDWISRETFPRATQDHSRLTPPPRYRLFQLLDPAPEHCSRERQQLSQSHRAKLLRACSILISLNLSEQLALSHWSRDQPCPGLEPLHHQRIPLVRRRYLLRRAGCWTWRTMATKQPRYFPSITTRVQTRHHQQLLSLVVGQVR